MPRQFRQARRNQRWRMSRQIKDRRRLNVFLVERRVAHLEGRQEVVALDLESTHDLLNKLEIKVQDLIERHKACTVPPVPFRVPKPCPVMRAWRWLRATLTSKGEP